MGPYDFGLCSSVSRHGGVGAQGPAAKSVLRGTVCPPHQEPQSQGRSGASHVPPSTTLWHYTLGQHNLVLSQTPQEAATMSPLSEPQSGQPPDSWGPQVRRPGASQPWSCHMTLAMISTDHAEIMTKSIINAGNRDVLLPLALSASQVCSQPILWKRWARGPRLCSGTHVLLYQAVSHCRGSSPGCHEARAALQRASPKSQQGGAWEPCPGGRH